MQSEAGPGAGSGSEGGFSDAEAFAPVDPTQQAAPPVVPGQPPFPGAEPMQPPQPEQSWPTQTAPAVGQPEFNQPEFNQPGFGQPGFAPPAFGQPGFGQQPPGPGPLRPGQPYGYPPYGYSPYGYGPPQPPHGTNGLAITSLVLGICGFFFITPIVGLVLGLVALSTIRRTGQKGKGLAVSGVVLSSVWIALFATFITVAIVTAPDPAQRDANGTVVKKGAVGIFKLHAGDCFTVPSGLLGSTDSKTRNLTVVPCATPHDSEVVGSFTPAEDSYPGLDSLRTESVTQCVKILGDFLPDSMSLPTGSHVQFIYGNQDAWNHGEHEVECFVQLPAGTMSGSIHRDPSSYTADQLRFVRAVQSMVGAETQLSATTQSAGLNTLQQRASDVASGMQSEIMALTGSPWPAAVQPRIDALVAQQTDEVALWRQAASAPDISTFTEAVRSANGVYDLRDMQAVRHALGLKTIVLGGAGGSGSGDGSSQAA